MGVEAAHGRQSGGEMVGGVEAGVGGLVKGAGGEVELLLRELQAESEDQEVCFGVHIPAKVVGLVIGLQHRHARQIRDTCRVELWTPLASDPVKTVVVRGQLRSCATALRRILGLARRPLLPASLSCEQLDTNAATEAEMAVRLVTDPEVLRRITGPSEADQKGCHVRASKDASKMCGEAMQGLESLGAEVEARHRTIPGAECGARDRAGGASESRDNRVRSSQPTTARSSGSAGRGSDSDASDDDPAPSFRNLRRRRRAGHCVSQSPSPSISSRDGSSRDGSRCSNWNSSQRGRTSTPSTPRCCKSRSPAVQRRTPSPCASMHNVGRGQTESLSQSWSPATPGRKSSPSSPFTSPLNSDNDQLRSGRHSRRRRRGRAVESPRGGRPSERSGCESEDGESAFLGDKGKNASPTSPAPDGSSCGVDKSRYSGDDACRDSGCSLQASPARHIRQGSGSGNVHTEDGMFSTNHSSSSPYHGSIPSLHGKPASCSPCSRPVSPSEEFESAKRAAAAAAAAASGRKVAPSERSSIVSACQSGGAEKQVTGQKRKRQVAANGDGSSAEPAVARGQEQRAGKAGVSDTCTPLPSAAAKRTPPAAAAVVGDSEKRRRLQYGRPQPQQPSKGPSGSLSQSTGVCVSRPSAAGAGENILAGRRPTELSEKESTQASQRPESANTAGSSSKSRQHQQQPPPPPPLPPQQQHQHQQHQQPQQHQLQKPQPQQQQHVSASDATEKLSPAAQVENDSVKPSQHEKMESSEQHNDDRRAPEESMSDVAHPVNCKFGPTENQRGLEEASMGFTGFSELMQPAKNTASGTAASSESTHEEADQTSSVDNIKALQVQSLQTHDVFSPESPLGPAVASTSSVPAAESRTADEETAMALVPSVQKSKEQLGELHHELCTLNQLDSGADTDAAAIAVDAATAAAAKSAQNAVSELVSPAVLPKDIDGESEVEQTRPALVSSNSSDVHSETVSGQSGSLCGSEQCPNVNLNGARDIQQVAHGAESGTDLCRVQAQRTEEVAAIDSALCASSLAECPVQKKSGRGSAAGRRAAEYKAAAAAAAKAAAAEAGTAGTSSATSASPAGSSSTVPTASKNQRAGVAGVKVVEAERKDKDSVADAKTSSMSLVVGSESKKARTFGSAGKWMQCWSTEGRLYWHDKSSGMSTWDKPSELMSDREKKSQWKAYVGPDNAPYYFNSTTGESTWDRPADLESDSDSPMESDSEPTTNVTAAGSCNDGTSKRCSVQSSPASHINSVQSLAGANLNSEECNVDNSGRDAESKQDSLGDQCCFPVTASLAAESEDCSRLSVDVGKEKTADKGGEMGPRGRGRPRGRGGKGRGAGGKRKNSRDSSLAGETGGGELAGGSNCKTPSVRGRNAALGKESLQTEAVTGCFSEAGAVEEAHAEAAVLDEVASEEEICSRVPEMALTDSAVDAMTSSVAVAVVEGMDVCRAETSAPADGAAGSEKSSTLAACDAKAADKRATTALEKEVEAEKKKQKRIEATAAAEVTGEVRVEISAAVVAAKKAAVEAAAVSDAAVTVEAGTGKEGWTESCGLSGGTNGDAAEREKRMLGSTAAGTQSTGDVVLWQVCQRAGQPGDDSSQRDLSPRSSNDPDLHSQMHRVSTGIGRENEEGGGLSAALDVCTPQTPAHCAPELCTPSSPYPSSELHKRLSESQHADYCMGFKTSGSYGSKADDEIGQEEEEVAGNMSAASMALPFRQPALSPEPTATTTRPHTSESPSARFGFGATALDTSPVQAGSRLDTPSLRGSTEFHLGSPIVRRPFESVSSSLADPAARKECNMSPWLASSPNNNRPSASPTNRPSCGMSTWCAGGLQSRVGDSSCNGEPSMGGESDEELGENLFDARTGSYDELYIGGTAGNVYSSQLSLSTSAGISDCAAPDLSYNSGFCGDSDVLEECAERQDCVRRPKSEGGAEAQSPGCDSDTPPDRGLGGGALGEGWWVGTGGNDRQAQKRCRKIPFTPATAADVIITGVGCSGRGSSVVMASGQHRTCSLCGKTGHNRRTCLQARVSSSLTDGLRPDVPNALNQAQEAQRTLRGEKGCGGSLVLWAGTLVEALYDDGLWYQGVIESYDSTTGRYKITFPDGESVTTPLPDDNFRVLSSARPSGPVQSDGSMASTIEHAENNCTPAPVLNGNVQVYMVAPPATAGGAEGFVAKPLDYAQACLLPRPTPRNIPPQQQVDGKASRVLSMEMPSKYDSTDSAACNLKGISEPETGPVQEKSPASTVSMDKNDGISSEVCGYHILQGQMTCANPDDHQQQNHPCPEVFVSQTASALVNCARNISNDHPHLPASSSSDHQIQAKAAETNRSGEAAFPGTESGDLTVSASVSEKAAAIAVASERNMDNSIGWHTSQDRNSSSESVSLEGKGSLVHDLIDNGALAVKSMTSSQPDKCLLGNAENESVKQGCCQLAISLSQSAKGLPNDGTPVKDAAFAARGLVAALGSNVHLETSNPDAYTVIKHAIKQKASQSEMNLATDPVFDGENSGAESNSVLTTANPEELVHNVAAPQIPSDTHISVANQCFIQEQGEKAALITMDTIVNDATSKQENKCRSSGASTDFETGQIAKKSDTLQLAGSTAAEAASQLIHVAVELEDKYPEALSSSEQRIATTEASSDGAVLSPGAVSFTSENSESGPDVHNGIDLCVNTNVCTADNSAGCVAGQETVHTKQSKRILQCDTAKQPVDHYRQSNFERSRDSKRKKLALSSQAVTESNSAVSAEGISQAGAEDPPWLWWWQELDLQPPRSAGRPAIGAHVVVQGQGQQAPRRGVVIDIIGKCWCNVALEDDEFGAPQNTSVLEPNHTVRCRTNLVRVISAAEQDRITATAAKHAGSFPAESDRRLETQYENVPSPQSLPLEKAQSSSTGHSFDAQYCCVDLSSSQQNIVQTSCDIQRAELISPVEQNAGLSFIEKLGESSQSSNAATEKQLSSLVSQSSEISQKTQQAGEERTGHCMNSSTHAAARGDQCVEQLSSPQPGCCDTISERSLLIIPVSDFTPVTAEPAISWAFFGSDYSGTLPQRMRAPPS